MKINSLKLYECGYCTHPEKIVYGKGEWKTKKFPAIVGLLHHPERGYILFDTGYGQHFFKATKSFPYSVYAKLTPVFFEEEKSIKNQLLADGIAPEDIKYIVISHFHGDHTGGLKDFPKAKILTFEKAYNDIRDDSKFQALRKGCLFDTLPSNIEERMTFLDKKQMKTLPYEFKPFTNGYDVFNDGSLYAVDLTGHAIGQFGIFVHFNQHEPVFLCSDAVWLSESYKELVYPSFVTNFLTADIESYRQNIKKLHSLSLLSPHIEILPTHCSTTWSKAKEGVIYE
ncbi:MBL fold metallo-hydrolase [Priestia filamentosa]|uniref:MBL fold metallo-hydrolase n=1 Tax=Priestia filamentosa TaxID=1402861 RepID=UPI00397CFE57